MRALMWEEEDTIWRILVQLFYKKFKKKTISIYLIIGNGNDDILLWTFTMRKLVGI